MHFPPLNTGYPLAVILGLSKKQTKWLSKMNINSYD